jgi:hypothetical protein
MNIDEVGKIIGHVWMYRLVRQQPRRNMPTTTDTRSTVPVKLPPICNRFREERSTVKKIGGYFWTIGPHPHDEDSVIVVGPFSTRSAAWRFVDDPGSDDHGRIIMFDVTRNHSRRIADASLVSAGGTPH